MENRYGDIDAAYCENCRCAGAGERCPPCPEPALLPEAERGVAAFAACATQWRQGFSGRTGLDYAGCVAALTALAPLWRAAAREAGREEEAAACEVGALLQDVQIIERAMLQADDERRAQREQRRD